MNLLNSVVLKTEYTGPRVKIDGYQIGGKTGTSELLNPNGGYYKDRKLNIIYRSISNSIIQNMLFIQH